MKHENEIKAIEAMAEDFANYVGEDFSDELGFGGDGMGNSRRNERFTFTLTNQGANAEDREIAINPGQFDSEADIVTAGYPVDGILRDGNVVPGAAAGAEVTAVSSNSRRTIKEFLKFVKANPTRCVSMIIQSDDPDQFSTQLRKYNYSPFRDLGSDEVNLEDYYDPDQFSSKKINVPLLAAGEDYQFDDQSLITMQLPRGRKTIVTIIVGAIDNRAKKLKKRADRAYKTFHDQLERQKAL